MPLPPDHIESRLAVRWERVAAKTGAPSYCASAIVRSKRRATPPSWLNFFNNCQAKYAGSLAGIAVCASPGSPRASLLKERVYVSATQAKGRRRITSSLMPSPQERELTMADIRKDSPVLADMESSGAIKIAGAMYNLETAGFLRAWLAHAQKMAPECWVSSPRPPEGPTTRCRSPAALFSARAYGLAYSIRCHPCTRA